MFASRMMIQRCVPSMARRAAFSTESAPAQKLREVLTQYRQENFSDETPSRFRKYIIKAVEEPDHENFQIERINTLLDNIGRSDARLSSEEIELLLKEAGVIGGSHYVPTTKLAQLM